MKGFYVKISIVASVMLAVGCSKDFGTDDSMNGTVARESDEAAALRIRNAVGEESLLRYMHTRKNIAVTRASELDIEPIVRGSDTLMYLVNYDGGGWDLLSADKRVPARLMFSEDGSVTLEDIMEHPGVSILFDDLSERIFDVKHSGMTEPVTAKGISWNNIDYQPESTRAISWVQIGQELIEQEIEETPHLLKTEWNQWDYNVFVPYRYSGTKQRTCTGCTIVAAAQMLTYLHGSIGAPSNSFFLKCMCDTVIPNNYDTYGETSYGYFNPSPTTYTQYFWEHITCKEETYIGGTVVSEETKHNAIATLMAYLGYTFDATYKRNDINKYATSADDKKIIDIFPELYGITCKLKYGYDPSFVMSYLLYTKQPIIITSYGDGGGHCWIMDGFYASYKLYNYYYQGIDYGNLTLPPQYKTVQLPEYEEYVRMNWGWSNVSLNAGYYANYDDWTVSPSANTTYNYYKNTRV